MPRKRLSKREVEYLGLKVKVEKYEKKGRNPRYTISKEQNKISYVHNVEIYLQFTLDHSINHPTNRLIIINISLR